MADDASPPDPRDNPIEPPWPSQEARLAELRAALQEAATTFESQRETLVRAYDPSAGHDRGMYLGWALRAYHARTLGILTEMRLLLELR